jgi:hypothetical protein
LDLIMPSQLHKESCIIQTDTITLDRYAIEGDME